jgi:O-antigen ligase
LPGQAAAFDKVIRGLILLMVFGTPLALGAVHLPAMLAFEWLALVALLVWVVRAVWVSPAHGDGEFPVSDSPGEKSRIRLFGHQLVKTRLGTPIAVFIVLVLFQLMPISPAIVNILSPATAKLYSESLPGYGSPDGVDFSKLGSFLMSPDQNHVVERIVSSPGELPSGFSFKGSSFRPLSIYPFVTVRQLLVLLALIALFTVSVNHFRSRRSIESTLKIIVLFGFVFALFGIIQRLSWNGSIFWVIPVAPEASPFGPFINHNHFAAFMAMIVPVAAGMLMDEGRRLLPGAASVEPPARSRRGPGAYAVHGPEPFARLLLAAFIVGVMAGAIAFSASRGAVLALTAAFVFYGGALIAQGRIRRGEAIAGVLILVLAAGLSIWLGLGPLAEKLYAIGNVENEPSLFSRILGWQWTVRIVSDFPLFGTGFGTFSQAWTHYYPPGTAAVWNEAHNDYLQLLSETGVIGFVVFVSASIIFAWNYILPGVLRNDREELYMIHGVAIGLIAVAIHSMVDFPLQITGCAVLFVVLSALLIAYRNREAAEA